ncbi:GntR family transcriptional regulator [Ahrensia kielensis]|uniref:GntR family transcriptional regulator n=1 Tax=Ahrensia kielensis TaxID=76980 RepID=UPI000379DC26|nr:GntR family transcriptional regulator [Ahrensia kielensis]
MDIVHQSENSRNVTVKRSSSADVFDSIYDQITSLELKPGEKVSIVEIAKQFDVSRQPVREAFIKLSNMGLLLVKPQSATIVRKISISEVADARFIRKSIEIGIARKACARWNSDYLADFQRNLDEQRAAANRGDLNHFRELDSQFHQLLCTVAGHADVYSVIAENKAKVDRLCALSFTLHAETEAVYREHTDIVDLLNKGEEEPLIRQMDAHLSRLDGMIEEVSKTHHEYFEA